MPLETFGSISDLDASNPVQSDGLTQADDHIRGIKSTLKTTFPAINAPVLTTPAKLNDLQNGKVSLAAGSANAPSLAFDGAGIYLKSTGVLGVQGSLEATSPRNVIPTGILGDFLLGAAIPSGWLELNGQNVSRTDYHDLWVYLGSPNTGDGSTTFTLPNFSGRFRRSRSGSLTAGTFQADQVGPHGHTATASSAGAHSHDVTGSTGSAADHSHVGTAYGSSAPLGSGVGGGGTSVAVATAPTTGSHTHGDGSLATDSAGAHAHDVTVAATTTDETRPLAVVVVTCVKV